MKVYAHQMVFTITACLLYFAILLHLRCDIWQSSFFIKLQYMDETLILICLIAHYAFSAFVPDIAARESFGVFVIVMILLVVLLHIVALVY